MKYLLALFVTGLFGFDNSDLNNYWQQQSNYNMEIFLDAEKNTVNGISEITYINNSPYELDRIFMNLYPKAFTRNSVKAREYLRTERSWRGRFVRDKSNDKWIHDFEITGFSLKMSGGEISNTYKIDDTVLECFLPVKLQPGDSLTINISWDHVVGTMFERSGREKNQYNMAHWYPRTAVFDQSGWNKDPFHAEGEFYGDFGNFRVKLDLPGNYIVGASGVVVEGDPGWNSVKVDTSADLNSFLEEYDKREVKTSEVRRTVTFLAENVHDFAWSASTDFMYENGNWEDVEIHILYNRKNASKWFRDVLKRTSRVMEWLSTNFGRYPYPQVTTLDRLRGGGMEYPMLVMNGSESESLISHEIGHIWYYGILANNEVFDAWLDEGFTSFQEDWYMMEYHKNGIAHQNPKNFVEKIRPKLRLEDSNYWGVRWFQLSGFDEPIKRKSHYFKNSYSYRSNAYNKPAAMLKELRLMMGDSLFLQAMHEYYSRWHLKHTNEDRFTSTISEVSGMDLDWFFDAWLHDTRVLDYALRDWEKSENSDGSWNLKIDIGMPGNRYYPVPIGIDFRDGTQEIVKYEDFLWQFDNQFEVPVDKEPVKVVLDPEARTMDIDFRNNYKTFMPHEFYFDWPGTGYAPRDRYVLKWHPELAYHDVDGFIPGLRLSRDYYTVNNTGLYLGYGTESGNIHAGFSGWFRPIYLMRGTQWNYSLYAISGVSGGEISFDYQFQNNSINLVDPEFTTGAYYTNAFEDTLNNLYDPGLVTVLYEKVNFSSLFGQTSLEFAAAPLGLSDWGFARFTLEQTYSRSFGNVKIRGRSILGKMWYDTNAGLPGQEMYTVEGAGSGTLFAKHYLRDESSMYGWKAGRNAYHLAGDANLRGFTGDGYSGAHQVATANLETYIDKKLFGVDVEVAGFLDGGLIWNNTFTGDLLVDAGFGIRARKTMLSKDFYLRVDFPWLKSVSGQGYEIDTENIVFGFQRSF